MRLSHRNDQVCAPEIFRNNRASRAHTTNLLALVLILATMAVGFTGLGNLIA